MGEPLGARLHQLIVEQAPDAVIFADREGVIRLWNPAAEALFGYSANEALGHSLDLIIPERFRERHWKGYRSAVAAGQTKYSRQGLPTRSVTKDRNTIYVDMRLAIVRDERGQPQGALSIVQNITERWIEERALRERLVDLERLVEGALGRSDARGK